MLHRLIVAMALVLTLGTARGEQVVLAQLPRSPSKGLSPAFQHVVVESAEKLARGDLQASPQDAPRKGVVSASPQVELRKSSLHTKKEIKEDARMKFFSIPVGTKTPQEMKLPPLRQDKTMNFYSIPVGARTLSSTLSPPPPHERAGADECQ